MAIIPGISHVVVDIVVDGKPLPEYLDEDDDESITPSSATKYVECMSGSHFGIRTNFSGLGLRDLGGGDAIVVHYYLDGQKVESIVQQCEWPYVLGIHVCKTSRYSEDGRWKERDFVFAELITCMSITDSCVLPIADALYS